MIKTFKKLFLCLLIFPFFFSGCINDFYIESKKSLNETINNLKKICKGAFEKNKIIKHKEKKLFKMIKNTKKTKLYQKYFFVKKKDIKYFTNSKYFITYKLPYLYKNKIATHYELFKVDVDPFFSTYMLYLGNKIIIKNIKNLYPFYLVNGKIFKYDVVDNNSFIINKKKYIHYILKNKSFYFVAGTTYFPKDIEVYIFAPDYKKYEDIKKFNNKIKKLNKEIFLLKNQ